MKTKVLFVSLTACVLALAAWLVHVPTPAQADEIPEKYRDTVRKGLEYLVKNQHKDGHWEGDGGKHPVAMTALVGLALLMEAGGKAWGRPAEENKDRKYAANVVKAAEWLMDKSKGRNGLIFSEHPSETARYMEGHGLATLFLVSVLETGLVPQDKLRPVLAESVKYIIKAQSTQGGWYHTSKVEGHDFDAILPTVIQIQALQAANEDGSPVLAEIISDAQKYLDKKLAKHESKPIDKNGGLARETASILACQLHPYWRSKDKKTYAKRFKQCQAEIPLGRDMRFGRDELTHYYYAQVVFSQGGYPPLRGTFEHDPVWGAYRSAVFDHLKNNQKADGSWPAADGLGVGPVYSTALWCTILQFDTRGHPLLRMPEVTVR